jgi:hypothetical protein
LTNKKTVHNFVQKTKFHDTTASVSAEMSVKKDIQNLESVEKKNSFIPIIAPLNENNRFIFNKKKRLHFFGRQINQFWSTKNGFWSTKKVFGRLN